MRIAAAFEQVLDVFTWMVVFNGPMERIPTVLFAYIIDVAASLE